MQGLQWSDQFDRWQVLTPVWLTTVSSLQEELKGR